MQTDIGLIGLGVMGQNLVLNMAHHGYSVAVYNRSTERVDGFLSGPARDLNSIIGAHSVQAFVELLRRPRKIMLMVKAGQPVDSMVEQLLPYLDKGDIIIDGGNSHYQDTVRRTMALEQKGLLFLGVGVSGGAEGALKGPSIMPGGSEDAWPHVAGVFRSIAAKAGTGEPCCDFVGSDGAGHFVKMVHNGIEYSDMQLIGEAYYLMQELLSMSAEDMHRVFADWNQGELDSYLMGITAVILGKRDADTDKPIVDVIMDRAGQKGTGKWTAIEALDLGIPVPSIAEAVFARCMSSIRDQRLVAASKLRGPDVVFSGDKGQFIQDLHDALYASKICSYAQGFSLLREASKEYGWSLDLGKIASLWRGGCIIRARFLDRITDAFERNPDLGSLLLDPYFNAIVVDSQTGWRNVVAVAAQQGIPVPAFSSALAYYDSYRRARLPANLIQAQRDYFGSHTYERVDRPGVFHTDWSVSDDTVRSEDV